jgi:MFS family permease
VTIDPYPAVKDGGMVSVDARGGVAVDHPESDYSSLPPPPSDRHSVVIMPPSSEPQPRGLSPWVIGFGVFVMVVGLVLYGWIGPSYLIPIGRRSDDAFRPFSDRNESAIALTLVVLPLVVALSAAIYSNVHNRRSRSTATVLLVLSGVALLGGALLLASAPSAPSRRTCDRCTTVECRGESLVNGSGPDWRPVPCPDAYVEGARIEVAAVGLGLMAAGAASGLTGRRLLRRPEPAVSQDHQDE